MIVHHPRLESIKIYLRNLFYNAFILQQQIHSWLRLFGKTLPVLISPHTWNHKSHQHEKAYRLLTFQNNPEKFKDKCNFNDDYYNQLLEPEIFIDRSLQYKSTNDYTDSLRIFCFSSNLSGITKCITDSASTDYGHPFKWSNQSTNYYPRG